VTRYGFFVDECVRFAVTEGLRAGGANVVDGRIQTQGWADVDILAFAAREKRILVSHDYDHGDLIFRDGALAYGVILLAPGLFTGIDAPDPFEFALQIAKHPDAYINTVTIIDSKRIRRKVIKPSLQHISRTRT
jgi:Domain of unknown function (DUF5615)